VDWLPVYEATKNEICFIYIDVVASTLINCSLSVRLCEYKTPSNTDGVWRFLSNNCSFTKRNCCQNRPIGRGRVVNSPGRSRVKISARRPDILTEIFVVFLQTFRRMPG
jgi:hypothetical protein